MATAKTFILYHGILSMNLSVEDFNVLYGEKLKTIVAGYMRTHFWRRRRWIPIGISADGKWFKLNHNIQLMMNEKYGYGKLLVKRNGTGRSLRPFEIVDYGGALPYKNIYAYGMGFSIDPAGGVWVLYNDGLAGQADTLTFEILKEKK